MSEQVHEEPILPYIKKMLGLDECYVPFDQEIVAQINTVFLALNQLGVGRKNFQITLYQNETWEDFLGDAENMNAVKSYVWAKVKMAFDPPASSILMDSLKRTAEELEFRLMTQVVENRKAAETDNP